jgi:hypothetical protein
MTGRIGSNSASSGYWNASGEATPSEKLPEKFVPGARGTHDISANLRIPPDWNGNVKRQPIVQRAQRTIGMKYLYVRGANPMPIHPLGADGTPMPWTSSFQRMIYGLIHNGGFNAAIFQAGYPGFNLGLSFKVPNINDQGTTVPSPARAGIQRTSTGPLSEKGGSRGVRKYGRGLGRGSQ